MRVQLLTLVACAAFWIPAGAVDAMPSGIAAGDNASLPITQIADACGPGLVRGRRGTCLRRPAVFSHGRIIRKGCGKPIGAGLRTPC